MSSVRHFSKTVGVIARAIPSRTRLKARMRTSTIAIGALFASTATWGQSATWNGSTNTQWITAGNWSTGVVPNAAGASVIFDSTQASLNGKALTLGGNVTVGSISVTGPASVTKDAFTLSGNTLTFDNSGAGANLTLSNGIDVTIASAIALNDRLSIADNSAWGGNILISGAIAGNGKALNVDVLNSASKVTLGGVVSGSGTALTKTSSGTLALNGANTFTGGVTLDGGQLLLGNNAALGTGGLTITASAVNKSLATASGANITVANALAGVGSDFSVTGGGSLIFNGSGSVALGAARSISVDTLTTFGTGANQAFSGGTLTKTGAGTLQLGSGNNAFTGLVVSEGKVNTGTFSGNMTLGTVAAGQNYLGTGNVSVDGTGNAVVNVNGAAGSTLTIGGSTLSLANGGVFNVNNAAVTFAGGTIDFGTGATKGVMNYTGSVTLGNTQFLNSSSASMALGNNVTFLPGSGIAASGIDFVLNGTTAQTVKEQTPGSLLISGNLNKTNAGTATLDSSVTSLMVGKGMTLTGGVLDVGNAAVTVANGITLNGGTLSLHTANQYGGAFSATGGSSTLLFNGANEAFSGMSFANNANVTVNLGGNGSTGVTGNLGAVTGLSSGMLRVSGWHGTAGTGGIDTVNASGLSAGDLNNVWFQGYNRGATVVGSALVPNGFLDTTWNNGALDLRWFTPGNWVGGDAYSVPNSAGAIARISNIGGTMDTKTIDLGGQAVTLGALYTTTGAGVTLGNGSLIFDSGVAGTSAILNLVSTPTLGAVQLNSDLLVQAGGVKINGVVSGAHSLTVSSGASASLFSPSNSFSSGVIVDGGGVYAPAYNASAYSDGTFFGTGAITVTSRGGTVAGSADLLYGPYTARVTNPLILNGTLNSGHMLFDWTGNQVLTGTQTISSNQGESSLTTVKDSLIFGSGFNFTGTGALVMTGGNTKALWSGNNTFSGGLTLNQGRLDTPFSGVSAVTIGALDAGNNYLGSGNITLSGASTLSINSGNVAFKGGTTNISNGLLQVVNGGTTTLSTGATLTTGGSGTLRAEGNVIFDGATLNTLNLLLAGNTNATVSATANNSSTINLSSLTKNDLSEKLIDSSISKLNVTGTTSITGGSLHLTQNNQLVTPTLSLNGGALNVDGHTDSITTLSLGNANSALLLGNRGGLTFTNRSGTWSSTALLTIQNNGVTSDWLPSTVNSSYVRFVNNPFNTVTNAGLLANIGFSGFEPGATVTQGTDNYYYLLPTGSATNEWSGAGTDANWGTAANWLTNTVPNAADASATIRSLDANLNGKTINVDAAYTIGRLNVASAATAFTVGGTGTLDFSGSNAGINQSTSAVTYASNLKFDSNASLNSTVAGAGNSMNITGTISGAGNITKTGGGFLQLGGDASGLTGNFIWTDGSHIQITNNVTAFGSGNLIIGTSSADTGYQFISASGANRTVNLPGGFLLQGNLAMSPQWDGAGTSSGNAFGVTLNGNGVLSAGNHKLQTTTTASNSAGTLNFNGVISGAGGLSYENGGNSGTLQFSRTNTFTGDFLWNGGKQITLGANDALGQGNLVINAGGVLGTTGSTVVLDNRLVVNNSTTINPFNTILYNANSSVLGNSMLNGTLTFLASGTSWFGKTHVLAGAGGMTISGGGTLVMQGQNIYAGATENDSTMVVGSSSVKDGSGAIISGPIGTGTWKTLVSSPSLLVYSDTAGVTSQTLSNSMNFAANTTSLIFNPWTGGGTNYANRLILDAPTMSLVSIAPNFAFNTTAGTLEIDSQLVNTSGIGGFTKQGAGTLQLTNSNNQISSGIIVSAGTLMASGTGDLVIGESAAGKNTLGNSTVYANAAGAVIATNMGGSVYLHGAGLTLDNGSTFFNQNAGSVTYLDSNNTIGTNTGALGTLQGAGTIAKTGAGTETKVGLNIVTPNLSVQSGKLTLTNSNLISGVGGISMSGGTLNLNNTTQTTTGVLTVSAGGGTVDFSNGAANSWFSVGSLSLNGNMLSVANWSGNPTSGLGTDRFILTGSSVATGTIYDTVAFGGGYADGAKVVLNADGQKVLVPLGTAFIWTGQTSNIWGQANWKQYDPTSDTWSYTGKPTSANDAVAFDDSDAGLNGKTVTVSSDSTLGSLSFLGTQGQAFNISGANLIMSRTSDTAPINVSGNSSPTINSNIILNFDPLNPTNNNLVINQNGTGVLTINGQIQGTNKTVTKNGDGTLALNSGISSFTNGFIMNGGKVQIGASSAVDGSNHIASGPLGLGTVTINGGSFEATGAARTLNNSVDIENSFTVAGPNSLTFAGAAGATGTISNPATITVADANGSLNFGANLPLSGSAVLTKDGAGALNFNENGSAYSGNIAVNAGSVGIGTNNGFGTGSVALANGTTLNSNAANLVVANNIGLGSGAETINANGTNNLTLNGVISGSGALTKTGSATLTLAGNSTYNSGTTISGGAVTLTNAAGAGTGAIAVGGNTLNLAFSGASLASPTAFANTLSGTGTTNVSGKFIKLTGNNAAYTGTLDIQANDSAIVANTGALGGSSVVIDNGGTLYVAPASGAFAFANKLSGAGTLNVNMASGTDAFSFASTTANGYTGTMQLGTGSMTLDANASAALANATLELDSGSTLSVAGSQSVGNFTMNGGTLNTTTASSGAFNQKITTGTFNATSGKVQLDLTPVANVSSLLKLDDGIANQLVAATTVTGNVSNLTLVDASGATLGATSTQNIAQGGNTVAKATFAEGMTSTGSSGNGLYVNYALTQLDLQPGQTLSLNEGTDTGTAAELKALVTGTGNLQIAASNAITISNAGNNYSGTTTVSSGTAKAGVADVFKNTGDMIVNSGATLDLNGFANQVNNLSGAGSVMASAALTANNTVASTFSGAISGSGALTKTGTGALTLAGASTYTGNTSINAGTLKLTNASGVSNGSATVASGAIMDLAFSSAAFNNVVAGAGTVDVTGNNVTLGGSNTLSGLWDITGSANVTQAANLGTAGVNLDGSSAMLGVSSSTGGFNFNNSLTGNGTLVATMGSGTSAFAFGAGAGSAFTGTLDMKTGSFALSGNNTATLTHATLVADSGSSVAVGSGSDQNISGLKFNGGTVAFNASVPGQTQADGMVIASTLDVSGTGKVQVNLPSGTGMLNPATGTDVNLLAQDDGTAATKLAGISSGGSVVGNANGLVLVDQNGSAISSTGQNVDISNGTSKVATGTYNFNLNTGSGNDGLYVGYKLTKVDIVNGQTLSLTPSTGAAGNATDLSAQVTGSGNLDISAGAGKTVSLSNATNSFTGATSVTNGTLQLAANNALGSTSGLSIANGATADINGKTQTIGSFTGNSGSTLNLNGGALSITNGGTSAGSLTGAGTLALNGGSLDVTDANAGLSADVTIASAANATIHDVAGLGNTGTITDAGTLTANGATGNLAKAINGAGQVNLSNAANVTLTGTNALSGSWNTAAGTTLTAATQANLGSATVNNAGAFIINTATDWTLANAMTGAGSFTKQGSGNLSITQANATSGVNTIAAGMLTLTNANGVGSGTVNVNTAAGDNTQGLTLALAADQNFANVLAGSGTTTVSGSNVATITGANASYTGNWQINGKAAVAASTSNSTSNLGSGAVNIATGGTLTTATSGAFSFNNALTGNGTLIASTGSTANAYNFGTGAGSAFTGTLDMQTGAFALSGQNTASLTHATLLADAGSQITVGSTDQTIGTLKFGGGTVIFDATVPAQNQANGMVIASTLDVNGTGTVQVKLPTVPGMPSPGPINSANLMTQDDGGAMTKLAGLSSGGSVLGAGGGLILVDQNGNNLQTADQSVAISNAAGTAQAATGTYGYRLNTGNSNDGLYVAYALKKVSLIAGQTLTLTPDSGASGLASDLSAQLTGSGNLEIAAGAGQTASVTNAANDYTGSTTVTSGTFKVGSNNAMGQTSGLTIANGATTDMNGMSQTVGSFTGNSGSTLNLNGGALSITNGGTSAGSLTGAGTLALNGGSLDVTGANAGLSADVTIASAANATIHDVTGLGNTGTMTDSGTLTVDGATGNLAKAINGAGQVNLSNAANVTLTGTNALSGSWNTAAGTTLTAATQANLGSATVNNAGAFIINTATDWTLANAMTGAGSFTKQGSGNLSITQANATSGVNTIAAGMLTLANANGVGSGTVNVNTAAGDSTQGLTLALAADQNFANVLAGSGTTTVSGSNTATITGANAGYTGNWQINGKVAVAASTSSSNSNLGSGTVNIATGGTLTTATNGAFSFNNALTGNGTLIASTGSTANAYNFGTGAGSAFTGTLDMQTGAFALSGQNTASLTHATLLADAGSQITVGSTDQTIGTLKFGGGTVIFDATVPAQNQANGMVIASTLDVNGTGTVQVKLPNAPGMINPGATTDTNLLSQDDAGTVTKLASGSQVSGTAANLALVDANGNALSNGQLIDISNGTTKVATGTYDYKLTTGSANDGLYVGYALKKVDIVNGQTLTLTPATGAAGNATDLSAQVTGSGNLEIAAGAGNTVSLSNASNSFTGATSVTNGTLQLAANNALGSTSGLTIANGATTDMNGMSQTVGSFTGNSGSTLNLNGGALSIANGGTSAGSLTGAGTLALNSGSLDVTGANAGLSADVTIASAANATIHDVAGLGNTGTMTDSGALTVDGATGNLAKAINGAGQVNLSNAANVTLTGTNALSGSWNTAAGTTLTAATQANLGSATVNNAGAFIINSATDWTLANAMTGAGSFTKQGSGNLSITQANATSGANTIDAGMLTLTNAGGIGSGAVAVNTTAGDSTQGLTLAFATDAGFANAMSGTGVTSVTGMGMATIAGNNSAYTGNWEITGKASVADSATASSDNLGSGNVNIAASGVLNTNTTGDFSLTNALSGSGALNAANNGGAFSFGSNVGNAFTGSVSLSDNTFALAGNNTNALTNASLTLGAGNVTTVGYGEQVIKDLTFNGGTAVFNDQAPADRVANTTITTTGQLDVNGAGTVRVVLPAGGWENSQPLPDAEMPLLEQDEANVFLQLVKSTGTVNGAGGNLALTDQDGNVISDAKVLGINQNGTKVADATYDYRLTSSNAQDGLYVNYGLTQLNLIGTGTQALVLAPVAGATGNAADMSAKLTGTGDLAIAAGSGNTVSLSNLSNDYTGATYATSGTLQLANDNVLGQTSSLNIAAGAAVDMNGKSQTVGALNTALGSTMNLTGALTISDAQRAQGDSNGGAIDNATLAGNGSLVIDPSVVHVNGVQADYTGLVNVNGGSQLIVNTAEVFNNAAGIVLDGANDTLTFGNQSGYNPLWSSVANGTTAAHISGQGMVQVMDGSDVKLTANNSDFAGRFQIGANSTLRTDAPEHLGTASVQNNGTLVVNSDAMWSLDNTVTGSGSVQKTGAGVLSVDQGLAGFNGQTDVQAGTLIVGDALTSLDSSAAQLGGSVHVAKNAMLSGQGAVSGAVNNEGVMAAYNALPGLIGYGNGSQTSHMTVGPLTNSGVVLLAGSQVGNTLTVKGGMTGQSGSVVMNTVMGGDNSQTDRLILDGGATSGKTSLAFINQGGAGDKTATGIQVVSAINGASTTTDAFQLDTASSGYRSSTKTLAIGAYDYSLVRGGNGGDANSWYLTSETESGTFATRPELGVYLANQSAATALFLHTMHDRMGEAQFSSDARNGDDSYGGSGWARVSGSATSSQGANGQLGMDSRSSLAQAGGDLINWRGAGKDTLHVGLMAGYGNVDSKSDAQDNSAHAKGTLDGYNLGAYATWYANQVDQTGPYVDSWVQFGRYDNHVNGEDIAAESYGSHTLQGSLEMGWSVPLYKMDGGGLFIEPQAQIIYSHYGQEAHTEANGTRVESQNDNTWISRLGTRIYGRQQLDNGNKVQPFLEFNWWHNQKDGVISMDGTAFSSDTPQNRYEAKAGVQAELGKRWSLWGTVGVQAADHGYSNVQGQAGVKYQW